MIGLTVLTIGLIIDRWWWRLFVALSVSSAIVLWGEVVSDWSSCLMIGI